MSNFAKRFWLADSGVNAIEFALVAPGLLVFFFGTAEVSNYIMASEKVASIASTAADLVSQDTEIDDGEMNDIMNSLNVIMQPFDTSKAQIRITEVDADNNGNLTVLWSDARNTSPYTPGQSMTNKVPSDVVPKNQGTVMAEVSFTYQTFFGMYFRDGMTVSDTFYLRPRRSTHTLRKH